jgi:nucleoid-associated protein YgaU
MPFSASEGVVRHGVILGGLGVAAVLAAAAGFLGAPWRQAAVPVPAIVSPPPKAADAAPPKMKPPAARPDPSFDIVKIAPDGSAVIAGRAAPGAKVSVSDGTKTLGETTADSRGEWVLLPPAPLPPGDRRLQLEARNADGGVVKSPQSVVVSVAPTTGEKALAVALPHGGGPARLLQRPGGPGPLPSLDTAEYTAKGALALSGRAAPGALVQIYLDERPLAAAKADATGAWSVSAPLAAGAGGHELRLDEIGADGRVVRRTAMPLVAALALQPAPGQDWVVQSGNNLWQIARRSYGSGLRYTIIYSANLQHIRNPDLIYPGQVFRVPRS